MKSDIQGARRPCQKKPDQFIKHRWLPASLLVAVMQSSGVLAQETPAKTQADDGAPLALESVTITARRRSEDSQSVPSPTSSVSGDDLAVNRISQVQDLQQVLPSTNAAFMHPRVSSVAVRGIGSNPANEGLEGSVGLYLDNVYLGRPGMLAIDLVDLEQVDLLRGPQGTLFGKNTTAGVLNISTKKPSFTPENSVELSLGNRGYYQSLASFSGPLNDSVAGRLSLAKTHDDGWLKNAYDGQRYDSIDRQGIRGQLLVKPGADFDLRLSADYNNQDDTQGTLVPYGFGPVKPGGRSLQAAALAAGAAAIQTDPKKYEVNFNGEQRVKVDQGGASAEANWHLASGFALTSITAWRFWNFDPKNDNDYTTASGLRDGSIHVKDTQFSQELRLASPKNPLFDYVVGAYYFYQDIEDNQINRLGDKADQLILNTNAFNGIALGNGETGSHGKATTNSYALFGQGNLHLSERLDYTAGLRYSYETKEGRTYSDPLTGVVATTNPTILATRNAVAKAWDSGNLTVDGGSWSYLNTLAYRFSERLLGYTSFSHGEKSGGINISGVGLYTVDSLLIKPEKSDNFEVGFKSQWLNRRLLVNANYFLTQVSDYQANSWVLPAGGSSRKLLLINAGDVESQGVEIDIKALPLRGLALNLNGSYNHARYSKFTNAPCSAEAVAAGATSCDLSGARVVGSPDWIVNLGARYDFMVSEGISQYVAANYAWRSSAEGYIDDSQFARIPAYGLLNLAVGWHIPSGSNSWDVSLWARNALDQHYFQLAQTVQTTNSGAYAASAGAPRTVGLSARYNF